MATSGEAYGISVGIYAGIMLIAFCLFSVWRRRNLTAKFYAPKRYITEEGYATPAPLGESFLGWIPRVLRMTEAEIISSAGVDAALYIKFLRMAWETFVIVTLLSCIIILPINITNDTVDQLMDIQGGPPVPPSEFTFWIPPPPPPAPPGEEGEAPKDPETPQFYNNTDLPDAPPGLEWTKYADDVPPLPPAPKGYAFWAYKSDYIPEDYVFTNLDKTTLSNIPPRSAKMVAHAIVSWAVTFIVFLQLWRYCKEALRLRQFYLLNTPKGAESHTVLCTDIPGVAYGTIPARLDGTLLKLVPESVKKTAFAQVEALGDTTANAGMAVSASIKGADAEVAAEAAAANISSANTQVDAATGRWEMPDRWSEAVDSIKASGGAPKDGAAVEAMVSNEFREIYQKDFNQAHLMYDTSSLDTLVATYDKTTMAAQDLVDDYISKKSRDIELKPKMITVIGAKLGEWGREKYGMSPQKVDAFEFYSDYLTHLRGEITKAQGEAKEKVYPTAFVTFNRRTSQVVASDVLMSEDLTTWRCQAAPRPQEIIWKNLGMRAWERSSRSTLMMICFALLTIFYLIPVAAVQGILTTNSLVGFIEDIPIASSMITAILPGLVLAIFMALLPPIIKAMNRWSGQLSLSEVDLSLMTKFFWFQVVTVFLGSFIAGSVANQLNQIINDPGSIVTLLGTAAPQTSIFFLTYITLRGMLLIPLSILRLVPFIIYWVKTKFLASTERAKARLWQNQMFSYGTVVPNDTMVILLALTFCLICPIIAPAAVVYFSTAYIVRKHDLLYVFRQPYQAGAMAWPRIFNQVCAGLIIFQLIMICLLALKKSIAGPIICVPLPFLTIAFLQAAHSTFWRPMEALSLMTAADIDKKELGAPAAAGAAGASPEDLYLSPSFQINDTEHAALLDDCKRMQAVLAGGTDDKLFARDVVDPTDFVEGGDASAPATTVASAV